MVQDQVQKLIIHSKSGDTKAFEKLITEFQPLVFRLAFRMLGDPEEAKDIIQETFIKVWLNLKNYNPKYKFSTWIYKIACNLSYDRLRSLNYISKETDPSIYDRMTNRASSENIESNYFNNELKELIVFFTNHLSPKQKLVFTLIDLEELEYHEVEKITNLSAYKIKSNLYLARKSIKEKITKIK